MIAAALTSSAFVWAQSTPAAGVNPFAADVNQRSFTVTGTVVSVGSGSLVVKIDDHGHPIPCQVADEVTVIAGQRSRGTRR